MLQETSPQTNAAQPQIADSPWSRVAFGPPEPWIEPVSFDPTVPGRDGQHLTHLLWARQVEAGTGRGFHATATRLETSLAVQHESQWSLELDVRTQRLTLHWLRVVRNGVATDQLRRERFRWLQRETQLERLVLDGRWTLLMVLDDVRPGDVIESAYTYETTDPIRPGGCEVFFAVPPQAVVGHYRLDVVSADAADLRFLASPDAPERREERMADGRRRWIWSGAQTALREPESNTPDNTMDHLWIQVSDLGAWSVLGARVAERWSSCDEAADPAVWPALARPERVDAAAIIALVTHLQEEFRYFSLDLQAGGWTPSSPRAVAVRRHGDCKDLAWLATTVLRGWGVKARPILVSTGFREKLAALLPMALLFNHAILEVEWEGATRWFDLTARGQGGGFIDRAVPWFGQGLPVDAADNELRPQPGERPRGLHQLRELILLDTHRGAVSLVEHRVRAEGWQADVLRSERLAQGAENFAKGREQYAQRRLGRARRRGELLWRDDLAANVCEIVEVFEVNDATHLDERAQRAIHDAPPSLPALWFATPEEGARRTPWAMPFPCELLHTLTIKGPGMAAGSGRRRRWEEPELEAAIDDTRLNGVWTRAYRFKVLAPEVAASRVAVHRKALEDFGREAGWRLFLPPGRPRPRRGAGFGEFAGALKNETTTAGTSAAPFAGTPSAPGNAATRLVAKAESAAPAPAPRPAAPPRVVDEAEIKLPPGGGRRRRTSTARQPDRVGKRIWVARVAWVGVAALLVALLKLWVFGGDGASP